MFDSDTKQNIDNILECVESMTLQNEDGQFISNKNERIIHIQLDYELYIHKTKIIIFTRVILDCGSTRSVPN